MNRPVFRKKNRNADPCFRTMNIKASLRKFYKKHGKTALLIFLVYFVAKWTLTIVFGAKLLESFKGWIN